MDWDLGVFPEPVGKSFAFNQLLDNLRAVYEEACARNAALEQELGHNGVNKKLESNNNDPWLPSNFLAPQEGPPPSRVPRGVWQCTPRTQARDAAVRQQEQMSRSIDKLAEQQGYLSEQIAKVLTFTTQQKRTTRSGLNGMRGSMDCTKSANGTQFAMQLKGCTSDGTASQRVRDEKASKKSVFGHTLSRFAVRTSTARKKHPQSSFIEDEETGGPLSRSRRRLRRMLNTTLFSSISGAIIFAYAVTIAVETNYLSQNPDMKSDTIQMMHYVFTAIFCAELSLRFVADGWTTFCGEEAFWNRLDAFFILSGATELFIEAAAGSEKAGSASTIARGVRILRVFRTVRLVRTFRQFYEFQKMAYALLSSFKTLLCSLALLIFVMFFFAVWFTQVAANQEMRDKIQDLQVRYGDLMSTAYTLFMSISGGISWDACFMPLFHLSTWTAKGFILYIALVYFGVLNVVTSVFVESVIRSVQHYKDIIVKDKEEEKKIAMSHVKEVFKQVDGDGSGLVSLEEMEHFLQTSTLTKYMEALDIDVADTRLLFRLLDYDGSGQINTEDFCEGCLRLKGGAKSIDVAALTFQVKSFLVKWGEFTGYVDESFAEIRQMVGRQKPGGLKARQ